MWDVVYKYMVDANSRFVCINISEQTLYYRENAAKIFVEFRDDYKYYMID